MANDPENKQHIEELQLRLHERDVEGVAELPEDEQEDVIEAAEHNPDPTTRREAIELEMMELGRSNEGGDLGS